MLIEYMKSSSKSSKKYKLTKKNKHNNNKTRKNTEHETQHKKNENQRLNKIVLVFLEMLNTIKLYHWKTLSFAQHKATDELYGKLQDHVDTFVEILMGKDKRRLEMVNKKIETTLRVNIDHKTPTSEEEYIRKILGYRNILIDLDIYFEKDQDSDLLNIRDEILGDLNQHLYLLMFH